MGKGKGNFLKEGIWAWWLTPLIPALGRQRQADLYEFQASLVYTVNSRLHSVYIEKPCLEKENKRNIKTCILSCT